MTVAPTDSPASDQPVEAVQPAQPEPRTRRGLAALVAVAFIVLLGALVAGVYLALGGSLPFGTSANAPTDTVKVLVARDGIVALSLADLRVAGLTVERLDTQALSLTVHGVPVPFFVDFDRLVFYGQAPRMPESLYTGESVYWLRSGQGAGLAMEERAVQAGVAGPTGIGLSRVYAEESKVFQAMAPAGTDPWMWAQLYAGAAVTETFAAPDATDVTSATLVVRVLSITDTAQDPDHHAVLRVNGQVVDEEYWNGLEARVITATVPAGVLRPGANEFSLAVPGDTGAAAELVFLDAFELTYPRSLALGSAGLEWEPAAPGTRTYHVTGPEMRPGASEVVLDIGDPARPVRITAWLAELLVFSDPGRRFAAVQADAARADGVRVIRAKAPTLQDETAGADYLVVGPADFAAAAQPLLDWRAGQGLSVRYVALEDVFDAYGGGQPSPDALRAFLRAAHAQWDPAPRYVLLAGDASYDYRDFLNAPNKNVVPTWLVYTTNSGQTASDVWYARADDGQVLFALGRLPADTPERLALLVEKIVAYEQAPVEDWARRALLVADNEAEFQQTSDELAGEIFSSTLQVDKIYFDKDLPEGEAHARIMSAVDQGVAVLNYIGHGSLSVWGDEKAFQSSDAAQLTNGGRLPLLVTYSCLNGFFQHPEETSLSETLLWKADGGIVAAVVPSGRSYTVYQRALADNFYRALFASGGARLGDALWQAQRDLQAGAGYEEVLLTFNLLGDPALRFVGTR